MANKDVYNADDFCNEPDFSIVYWERNKLGMTQSRIYTFLWTLVDVYAVEWEPF